MPVTMIEIDGKLINTAYILTAEVVNHFYVNGRESELVVKFYDGSRFVRKHGFGFDAFAALEKIKEQYPCLEQS
jgi:hypothetical protein